MRSASMPDARAEGGGGISEGDGAITDGGGTDGGPTPAPGPQAPDVDGGTPPANTGLAGIGYPSGCSSVGSSIAWLALPLLAFAFLRCRTRRG